MPPTRFDAYAIHGHHVRDYSDSDDEEYDPHETLLNQLIFGPENEVPVDLYSVGAKITIEWS